MKKLLQALLCLALLAALAACGSRGAASGKTGDPYVGVKEILDQGAADAARASDGDRTEPTADVRAADPPDMDADIQPPEASTAPEAAIGEPADGIDVDLTILSTTMVYSEVYNMMMYPEEYIGKTVKMDGLFAYYHDEATGNDCFACIIQDATVCCAQGIEFVLTEDYSYPADYPEVDEEICVVGIFDTYEENGYTYYTLREASLF